MSISFEERKKVILNLLDLQEKVKVSEAEEILNVSGETIRRDMDRMEKEGLLQKVHGGAIKVKEKFEGSFEQRSNTNAFEKRLICKAAADLVEDDDVIFIGHGSTAHEMIKYLNDKKNITVITNSLPILNGSDSFQGRILFSGGQYNRNQKYTGGPVALDFLNQFKANKTFIAAGGLSINDGITDFEIDGAHISKKMIQRSDHIIVLADHTKLGKTAFVRICELSDISTLITNQPCSNQLREKLAIMQVDVIIASEKYEDIII